jgi:hypothetical protein
VHGHAHRLAHAFDLLRRCAATQRRDQEIVGEVSPVRLHLALGTIDQPYVGWHERDVARQRHRDRLHHVVPRPVAVHAERKKQQPRLVDMQARAIDYRDRSFPEIEPIAQQVGRQRAARAGAQDHNVFHGGALSRAGMKSRGRMAPPA